MRTYTQMESWTRRIFDANGFRDAGIYPGPELRDTPNAYVIWTRYGGPGLILDGTADDRSWQARCVGRQGDYGSAEALADLIDLHMVSHYSSEVEGVWVSGIQRVGGAPTALLTDDAERTHFVCSYIVSVEMALLNG